MTGTLDRQKSPHLAKSVKKLEIEESYVLKFFADDRMPEGKEYSI
jgi:hypothetical protein